MDSKLIFRGKSGSGDYHNEMNIQHFMEWFAERLVPNLPARSAIILDNAKYHNAVLEKVPTMATKKCDIQEWLARHGLNFSGDMKKTELLQIVRANRPSKIYRTDLIAEAAGHKVLRLPVAHCELNPIEMVWAQVKGYAAQNNKLFTMAEATRLAREGVDRVTSEKWKKCVEHVADVVEPSFNDIDRLMDSEINEFVIHLDDR